MNEQLDQFLQFLWNHPFLTGMWLVTLLAIVVHHRRSGGQALRPHEAVTMINRQNAVVLDIREKKEFEAGHVVQSFHIPLARLKQRLVELKKHRNKPIVVVCKMGQQSSDAVRTLKEGGFEQVYKLAGGITEWKAQSLPLVQK